MDISNQKRRKKLNSNFQTSLNYNFQFLLLKLISNQTTNTEQTNSGQQTTIKTDQLSKHLALISWDLMHENSTCQLTKKRPVFILI